MNPVIAIFTLIGMVIVAMVLASVLTPILLFLLDRIAVFGVWLTLRMPLMKQLALWLIKQSRNIPSPKPKQATYSGKYRIYIPKPFQRLLNLQVDEKNIGSIPTIEDCDNSNKTPLPKDTSDMVNQPIKNKASHSEDNLTQEQASGQPKTNGTFCPQNQRLGGLGLKNWH